MRRIALSAFACLLLAATLGASDARAVVIGGNPGPQYNYICPHADAGGPLDCYFDAVVHLYTMCRNVHAIEILEFGYEDSKEGEHAAKYEYCLDKQKQNIEPRYKAALKEAHISKQAVEGVRSLHEYWLGAMQHIRWNEGESDDAYKTRLAHVYDELKEKIEGIRTIVAVVKEKTSPIGTAHAKPPAKAPAKSTVKSSKPAKSTPKTATGAPANAS
ncbi:MAG TPA: hypothetical protein VGI14_19670 [Casimicrobiaceae bacterium]|jgi:hypothetical protein